MPRGVRYLSENSKLTSALTRDGGGGGAAASSARAVEAVMGSEASAASAPHTYLEARSDVSVVLLQFDFLFFISIFRFKVWAEESHASSPSEVHAIQAGLCEQSLY